MSDDGAVATIPTFEDVIAAAKRMERWAVRTPLLENEVLNSRTGMRVLLKPEMFQHTGSFKFRGASNAIQQLSAEERSRGVVAFSSGNHAQGVAAAAVIAGIAATIVMPKDTPALKVAGTKRYGAEIVFYDRQTEDREAISAEISACTGAVLIRPFDDARVIAGQGTIGLELASDAQALKTSLDAVVIPCGGGGLTAGIALALAETSPRTKVFTVEPAGFDVMGASLSAGMRTRVPSARPPSIADALMPPLPGILPFTVARRLSVSALTVEDAELARAVSFGVRHLKFVVEPAGAAALAIVLEGRLAQRGGTVAVVLSGGNCEPSMLARCCDAVPDP